MWKEKKLQWILILPNKSAYITIHSISIEPRATYPQDMDSIYNFEGNYNEHIVKSIRLDISDIDQIDFKNPAKSSKKLITSLMYVVNK